MISRAVPVFLCVFSLVAVTGVTEAQTPAKLLRWVPADANAVIVIDVKALLHSPLAQRENWRKQAGDRFANQEISIPPESLRAVMATQLDLGGTLHPIWELGILELEHTPSFALIARRDGGQLDKFGDHAAVRLSSGRTGVELEPGVILTTPQPNRQIISRWISAVKTDAPPQFSRFLQNALEQADRQSPVVMALDLADSVTVAPAREMLARFEPLEGKTADQADIAEILASVRGVVLTARATDKREGTIRVEFSKPTALIKPVAKPLVDEILRSLQISLTDFDHWTAEVSGTTLQLSGEFSPGDLRRVVSLFAASPATRHIREQESSAQTSTPTVSPEAQKAEISRKYFHSVRTLVDELKKTLGKTRDNHVVWMERYARKIDDLPIKDVDEDLLTFGGNVSNSLRYQAQAGRSAALRSGVRQAQPVYQSYSYGAGAVGPYGSYGGYSFSGTVRVEPERGQIRTEEHATAVQVKNSEMKQIEDGMSQMRREMTKRYGIEF
jgi:hypothetical protein